MYIEGPPTSGRTTFLVEKFSELLLSGVSTSEILVITQNSHKKNQFIQSTLEKLEQNGFKGAGSFPVHTFNGIVYHAIIDNWAIAEQQIPERYGSPTILPDLRGLCVSEYLLKESIKEVNKDKDISRSFRDYPCHRHLKQQLFRRFRLIAENNLTKKEIESKSALLNESFAVPADRAINIMKEFSLKCRIFDFLRQTSLFMTMLEAQKISFKHIKYLLADDFDELSYSAQHFIRHVINEAEEFYIAADPDGGARRGYLCAYPQGYEEIKKDMTTMLEQGSMLPCSNVERFDVVKLSFNENSPTTAPDAQKLFESIKTGIVDDLETIKLVDNSVRHIEMMEHFFARLKILLFDEKIPPEEITIIGPNLNTGVMHRLKSFFEKENIEYQLFSGSKRFMDDEFIYGTVILLQLMNKNWKLSPKTGEIRTLFTGILGFPVIHCEELLSYYTKKGTLKPEITFESKELEEKYKQITGIIHESIEQNLPIREQAQKIFSELIAEHISQGKIENLAFENFNEMLESLESFRKIAAKTSKTGNIEREWIVLVKDTVVSDNPAIAQEVKSGCVKIATPQKVVDLELSSHVQLWLDASSPAWFKEDTGPLYNSWVFQKNWANEEYTPQHHRQLTAEKTACLLRKLALCAKEKILCFASQLDESGNENSGQLFKYVAGKESKLEIHYEFTPRPDQKPVLDYQRGEMAISAVPGAGKTKILEALIIKLMQQTDPEKLLVLTYMDSAARNIRDRINASCENLTKFPCISTIHSLGMSIIRDNDNSTRLNLSSDFQVCDDSARYRIMTELYNLFMPDTNINTFMNDVGAAISTTKQLNITVDEIKSFLSGKSNQNYSELTDFLPLYQEYERILKSKNMIDFDDILVFSVKLLRNNPEIRDYYQQKFDYIMEDEAQDSSSLQQELLSLISKGNIIRCGDPNQAITSSFSASEVDNFKSFIKTTKNTVEMTGSQRCTRGVYTLANDLIDWAEAGNNLKGDLKGAFMVSHIQPVPGVNPDIKDSVSSDIYRTQQEEKQKVLEQVVDFRESSTKRGEKMSIGVLLRGNKAVVDWANFLEEAGVSCICYSDAVGQKKMFRFIKSWLEVLNNPWNNRFIKDLYKEFAGENLIKTDFDSAHFLDKLGTSFIYLREQDLPQDSLIEFRQHIMKWLDNSSLADMSVENVINELGDAYFTGVIDRSNTRIISLIVEKYRNRETDTELNLVITLQEVVDYLRELALRKRLGGIRFFEEIEKNEHKNDFVQLMTVHKAKGLEFDAVFLPEMQEGKFYYPINADNIDIGGRDRLINQIRQIKNKHLSAEKMKRQQVHEHLRLIYVGITRAKLFLHLSASEVCDKSWVKEDKFRPSEVLTIVKPAKTAEET